MDPLFRRRRSWVRSDAPRRSRSSGARRSCLLFRLVFCLALGLTVLSPGPARADASSAARPRVVVATLSDFPPYCFSIPGAAPVASEDVPVGANSTRLQGFAWDVVREALHAVGVDIELKVAPWARVMHYLDSGQADLVFPAMHTPRREQRYRFSRQGVIRSILRMYVRADSGETWSGLPSWAGREVAVIQGWAYGPEWERQPGILKHSVFSVEQGFAMLEKGRVEGVAGYEVPFDVLLRARGLSGRFRKLPPWGRVDEYVIAPRDAPEGARWLDAFDRGLTILRADGRLDRLYAKWNIPAVGHPVR